MSGGHWDYVGFRIRSDLESIASDEAVKRRWPRLAALLAGIAVLVEEAEHEMDWDLSNDSRIEDDKAFEDRIVHGILESAMKVANDRSMTSDIADRLQEIGFSAARAEILNTQRIFMAERHLWQAIARTASKWHIDMAELTVRLAEARAAGLTWEEQE